MRTLPLVALLAAALVASSCTRTPPPARGKAPEAGPAQPTTLERTAVGLDTPDTRARREALVASIEASGTVTNPRVLGALRRVPRHFFVPSGLQAEAYADYPLPIGKGQTISQPRVVADMTDALELSSGVRVLEIGTGSGYQAAILSVLAAEVYTIEIVPELGKQATRRLRELGYSNVHVRIGDGYAGWPEHAPFARIILTAAPPELPGALLDQLADGGVLVAPVGEQGGEQWIVRVRRKGRTLTRERLGNVRFVPMVRGR